MTNTEAELRRDAKRKARILKNPEGRINKILGQPEQETPILDKGDNKTNISPLVAKASESQTRTSPEIQSRLDDKVSEVPTLKPSKFEPEKKIKDVYSSETSAQKDDISKKVLGNKEVDPNRVENNGWNTFIWMTLGIMTRILLSTEYSWIIGNSAIATFVLTYIFTYALQLSTRFKRKAGCNKATPHALVEVALRLCGVPAYIIETCMSTKKICEAALKAFSLFFVPFVMVHIIVMILQAHYLSNEGSNN